jgi:hypothetical protein
VAGVLAAEIAAAGITRVFTFPGGGSNLPVDSRGGGRFDVTNPATGETEATPLM